MPTPPLPWPKNQEQRRRDAEELGRKQQTLAERLRKAKTAQEREMIALEIENNGLKIEKLMREAKMGID